MWGGEDEVFGIVDQLSFLAGIGAPKQEYDVFTLIRNFCNDCVGELLPPAALVAAGLVRFDGEGRVQ